MREGNAPVPKNVLASKLTVTQSEIIKQFLAKSGQDAKDYKASLQLSKTEVRFFDRCLDRPEGEIFRYLATELPVFFHNTFTYTSGRDCFSACLPEVSFIHTQDTI